VHNLPVYTMFTPGTVETTSGREGAQTLSPLMPFRVRAARPGTREHRGFGQTRQAWTGSHNQQQSDLLLCH
jgi:hypothetical protein